jgi:hypothetical protein
MAPRLLAGAVAVLLGVAAGGVFDLSGAGTRLAAGSISYQPYEHRLPSWLGHPVVTPSAPAGPSSMAAALPAPPRAAPSATPAPVAAPPRATAPALTASLPASARVADAMSRLSYPWRQLGYTILFEGAQAGVLGTTDPGRHVITIYVRPDESAAAIAHVVAHEIGHAIDRSFNDSRRRQVWLQLRGINSTTQWFTCSLCDDFAAPAGDFAETFAYWQLNDYSRSEVAPPPSPATMQQLSTLFYP